MENIDHIQDMVTLINADINDGYLMVKPVGDTKPDICFHLSA